MNELRKQLGFSLQELEAGLFTWMAHQFADVLVKALEQIDDWLAEQRDRRRFRMRDMQPRTGNGWWPKASVSCGRLTYPSPRQAAPGRAGYPA